MPLINITLYIPVGAGVFFGVLVVIYGIKSVL